MNYYNLTKKSGFSLVETLVAISVLLIVMVGPMTMTSRTAKSATFATEQVQAFFLAQEGLELAETLRDELFLDYFDDSAAMPDPWARFYSNTGIYSACYGSNGCGLEWFNETNLRIAAPFGTLVNCSTLANCRLYYDEDASERSRFTHQTSGNTATPFTRQIRFQQDGNNRAVRVISSVTWRTGSLVAEQRVETTTYLYNIYDLP